MRNDLPKAITAEDVIRRFDLSSLVKDRRKINENKDGLDKTENILYNFIDGILKGLNNTENQVDGKISTWFFNGIPTLENEPTNAWNTDTLKNNHIGDLYYDKANGNTYQFIYGNEEYSWQQILDDDVNEAMALANSNPDTQDGLRNIFVIDPIPPYEVGDMWIKSNGDIYRCIVARSSGNLNLAEWVISSEYSNDNYVYDAKAIIDSFNEFITANYVCKVLVKTTNNSIELSVSSATAKITNDYTTAISESEGRAEIRENQVLLSAKSYTYGEIKRVEGEIGDIADITQTEESNDAKVSFTNVPLSEPININIHPIGENISYLYPSLGLFPSNNLYLKVRTLRFTNKSEYEITQDAKYTNYRKYYSYANEEYTLLVAGTDYTIGAAITGTIYQNTYQDYELPDDLLYYDSDNYDSLEMDYGNQICKVTKKCKYNADGSVSLLTESEITNYPYPQIELTLGDYDIELLGYTTGYIFARLMSNNVYVGQFTTKAQLNASVNVLPHTIELTTEELVSGTQCGITIKLRDANGNELDSKEANITLSGLVKFTDLAGTGTTEINGSNITTGIIKSSNYESGVSGVSINLNDGIIDSKNFKVNSSGNIISTGGTIGGWDIREEHLGTPLASPENTYFLSQLGKSAYMDNGGTRNWYLYFKNKFGIDTSGNVFATGINLTEANVSGTINSSSGSIGGWTLSSSGLSNNRSSLYSNGELSLYPSTGGVYRLADGAMRFNAQGGVALVSSSNGSVYAGNGNLDLKACSGHTAYIGCMGNSGGTIEKAGISIEDGLLAFRSTGYATYNGSTVWGSSSKNTKENIVKLNNQDKEEVYSLLKNIPLISFDYKKQYSGQKNNYGFLIEDIENTKLKTLLHINQSETNKDIKTYSTEDLVRLELVVIQELMKKIEKLEEQL